MDPANRLKIVEPERMSILGLMLSSIIRSNLDRETVLKRVARLDGKVGVTAGKMSITMAFDRSSVTLTRGLTSGLRARVNGSLDSLLQVSLGKSLLNVYFSKAVSFSGNPLFLIKILPLIRVPAATEPR